MIRVTFDKITTRREWGRPDKEVHELVSIDVYTDDMDEAFSVAIKNGHNALKGIVMKHID